MTQSRTSFTEQEEDRSIRQIEQARYHSDVGSTQYHKRVSLLKSKKRVADHGEVFTPRWLVEDMLNQVETETERIDSRFLEPACGSGNFLIPVLERKLAAVQLKYGKNDFEKKHYALFGLMCIYGIELLADNVEECRENLVKTFIAFLKVDRDHLWTQAAIAVVYENIVQGDALKMTTADGEPIKFPEWGYLGKGKYQRSDYLYDNLTQRSSFRGTLFEQLEEHEVFTPDKTYPPMTVTQIASLGGGG